MKDPEITPESVVAMFTLLCIVSLIFAVVEIRDLRQENRRLEKASEMVGPAPCKAGVAIGDNL